MLPMILAPMIRAGAGGVVGGGGEPVAGGGAAPPGPPRQRLLQQVRQTRARGQVGAGVTAADNNQHSIENRNCFNTREQQ